MMLTHKNLTENFCSDSLYPKFKNRFRVLVTTDRWTNISPVFFGVLGSMGHEMWRSVEKQYLPFSKMKWGKISFLFKIKYKKKHHLYISWYHRIVYFYKKI